MKNVLKEKEMNKNKKMATATIVLVSMLTTSMLMARTKLTTLPQRDNIRVDLSNTKYTLVEEERYINMLAGKNKVEFFWQNTSIDMSSIQFTPIKNGRTVNVINVNYPPGESALFWEVYSKTAGPLKFRISYLINNIKRKISYEAIADKKEKFLQIKQFVTLINGSGESFKSAWFNAGYSRKFKKDLEYQEAKKLLALTYKKVPIKKAYHFYANTSKQVKMYYELLNKRSKGMGKLPFDYGKIRIYQQSGNSEAFIGEDWGKYTPVGEKLELFMGEAKEVKVKRSEYSNKKTFIKRPVFKRTITLRYKIENFKKEIVPLMIYERMDGKQWQVTKIRATKFVGERNNKKEKSTTEIKDLRYEKENIYKLNIFAKVPRTKAKTGYYIYVTYVKKNRW